MKVLQINSVCGIRSTGRIVTDIAEEYIINGHECRIAYGREDAPEKYRHISYKIGSEVSVRANGIMARFFDNEGFSAKRATKRLINWANEYNPDVLWLHNLHGYYINIDLLFNWIKSRPNMEVRWTLHDCWAFTGHCAHFTYVGCNKWKTKCEECHQKKEYPKSLFIDASNKNFNRKRKAFTNVKKMTLIAPSKWLANLIRESFLKEYPIEIKNNTIDDDVFKPTKGSFREKNGLEGKKIVLGVASAWNEKKGLKDFIELSKILDSSYKVVLVGLTKKQIKKMPNTMTCIARTNSARELAEIYTAADVFVNLTYEDNYPTVNLEARACGTPCITYRTGGSIESVLPENIVGKGDLQGIVDKIVQITT